MEKRLLTIVVVLLVSALTGWGVVLSMGSTIPDADGTIHACYKTHENDNENQGQLRIVSDPANCKSNEESISWQGPTPTPEPPPVLFTLTVTTEPPFCATVHGSGTYAPGTVVTTNYTDLAPGCDFKGWTITSNEHYGASPDTDLPGCTGSNNECIFTLRSDIDVVYRFGF